MARTRPSGAKLVDVLAATTEEREERGEFLFTGAGDVMLRHREARALTVEAVAQKLGVNKSTISRYEQNKTPLSDYAVSRFAEAFDIDPEVLMLECVKKLMPGLIGTPFGQLLQSVVETRNDE